MVAPEIDNLELLIQSAQLTSVNPISQVKHYLYQPASKADTLLTSANQQSCYIAYISQSTKMLHSLHQNRTHPQSLTVMPRSALLPWIHFLSHLLMQESSFSSSSFEILPTVVKKN